MYKHRILWLSLCCLMPHLGKSSPSVSNKCLYRCRLYDEARVQAVFANGNNVLGHLERIHRVQDSSQRRKLWTVNPDYMTFSTPEGGYQCTECDHKGKRHEVISHYQLHHEGRSRRPPAGERRAAQLEIDFRSTVPLSPDPDLQEIAEFIKVHDRAWVWIQVTTDHTDESNGGYVEVIDGYRLDAIRSGRDARPIKKMALVYGQTPSGDPILSLEKMLKVASACGIEAHYCPPSDDQNMEVKIILPSSASDLLSWLVNPAVVHLFARIEDIDAAGSRLHPESVLQGFQCQQTHINGSDLMTISPLSTLPENRFRRDAETVW